MPFSSILHSVVVFSVTGLKVWGFPPTYFTLITVTSLKVAKCHSLFILCLPDCCELLKILVPKQLIRVSSLNLSVHLELSTCMSRENVKPSEELWHQDSPRIIGSWDFLMSGLTNGGMFAKSGSMSSAPVTTVVNLNSIQVLDSLILQSDRLLD